MSCQSTPAVKFFSKSLSSSLVNEVQLHFAKNTQSCARKIR
ncbi:unnamed protein product, partial [Staurois parvus]